MEFHRPPFRLRDLKIEVTHECPLNCLHCSSEASPSNGSRMQLADCIRIIGEARALGAKEIAFSGGEPLGWLGIADAVRTASAAGLDVTVYTSGTAPDTARILDTIRQGGARRTVFSVFGAAPQTHEWVTRIAGSFAHTTAAIRRAVELGFDVEFHFVPFASTYRELRGVVELARVLTVRRVSVLRLVPQGRGALVAPSEALDRMRSLELKRAITDLRAEGFDIRTGSPYNYLLLNEDPSCKSGIDRLIVDPDLRVYPCDAFKRVPAESLVGTSERSRLDTFSLAECWEHSPYLNAVRKYLTTDFPDACAKCSVISTCLSGCLAQKIIMNGNLVKRVDPDCLMGRS